MRQIFGIDRAFPAPIQPEEVQADIVICTHSHEDHFDPGTVPLIARDCARARFLMPPSAMSRAVGWAVSRDRISALRHGESVDHRDVKITATPARHDASIPGWEVPDAMGVMVEADGIIFYHSGDTEYDVRLRALKSWKPDVATYCINGLTGIMDAHEAALLAWQTKAATVIPHRHVLWAETGVSEGTLDPKLFQATYQKLGGAGKVLLPEIGWAMEFTKAGA